MRGMVDDDATSKVVSPLAAGLAALRDAPRYRPGPDCRVAVILRDVTATEPGLVGDLRALLDDEKVPATSLAQALTDSGHQLSPQTVSRHRRRSTPTGCRCPR